MYNNIDVLCSSCRSAAAVGSLCQASVGLRNRPGDLIPHQTPGYSISISTLISKFGQARLARLVSVSKQRTKQKGKKRTASGSNPTQASHLMSPHLISSSLASNTVHKVFPPHIHSNPPLNIFHKHTPQPGNEAESQRAL
jgi:hypothetical protein